MVQGPSLLHRCRSLDSQTKVYFQFCLGTLALFPHGWCGGPHKASRLLPYPGLLALLFPEEWLTNSSSPSPPPEAGGWFSRVGDSPRLHPLSQLTNNRYLPHPCHLQTKHCLWPIHRAVTVRPVEEGPVVHQLRASAFRGHFGIAARLKVTGPRTETTGRQKVRMVKDAGHSDY